MKTVLFAPRREVHKPPKGALPSLGKVTVRYGSDSTTVDVTPGMTVGRLRAQVSEVLNIPAEAYPVGRGGATVSDDARVVPGTTVEVIRTAGENG